MGCGASKSAVAKTHEPAPEKPASTHAADAATQPAATAAAAATATAITGAGADSKTPLPLSDPANAPPSLPSAQSQTYAPCPVLLLGSEASLLSESEWRRIAADVGGSFLEAEALLRDEVKSGSAEGMALADMIRQGKILPSATTAALVRRAASTSPPPQCLLGFPKSVDNLAKLEADLAPCALAVYLEMEEETQRSTLAARGYDEARVRRKSAQFKMQTQPLVEHLERRGVVKRIPAGDGAADAVRAALRELAANGTAGAAADVPTGVSPAAPGVGVGVDGGVGVGVDGGVGVGIGGDGERRVVLVLGYGDGCKERLCQRLSQKYGASVLSASLLLKEEVKSGSPLGIEVADMIRQGKIVPAQTTIDLIKNAMATPSTGGGLFLIEGFPRSVENLRSLEEQAGDCTFALLLDATDEALERRAAARASEQGKAESAEALQRRLRTFRAQISPIAVALDQRGGLRKIDADADDDAIFEAACAHLDALAPTAG